MMMKKLSAVALAAAMSFSLSACTLGSTSWILKYGDDNQEVPTGIYVQNMYTAYSAAGQYATGGDTLLESSIEDKTADQWIRDTAMNLTKQYLAVTLKFDELGLTLTEAENTNIQSMVDSVWKSYGESYTLMGVNRDSYQKMLEYTAKTGDLFQHFYGEGGELAPTEEEYKQYFNDNYDRTRAVSYAKTSVDTMTEDELDAIGAGDQGMMFGFASNETEEYMPYPISLAHKLTRQLTKVRKDGTLKYLRPDGKSQVTVEYDENGKPYRLDAVVLSTQHDDAVTQEQIHEDIKKYVFDPVLPAGMVDENTKFYINPTGRFVIGGPHGDSGLTGRKIIVDTYGGYARHGGGAFSGKDCTKVDRSAAYAARYVAKNMVAAGLADKCEVQLSYAIGVAHPTSIEVDTFGTGKLSDDRLVEIIREHFDLRPAGIIKMLDLRRPIYKQTAAYGHFGRTDVDLPWEKLDKVDVLKKYL